MPASRSGIFLRISVPQPVGWVTACTWLFGHDDLWLTNGLSSCHVLCSSQAPSGWCSQITSTRSTMASFPRKSFSAGLSDTPWHRLCMDGKCVWVLRRCCFCWAKTRAAIVEVVVKTNWKYKVNFIHRWMSCGDPRRFTLPKEASLTLHDWMVHICTEANKTVLRMCNVWRQQEQEILTDMSRCNIGIFFSDWHVGYHLNQWIQIMSTMIETNFLSISCIVLFCSHTHLQDGIDGSELVYFLRVPDI